ncbi:MAG: hypothetical protein ACTSPB_00100 [Candidatus Thorarchaeota archaeon]
MTFVDECDGKGELVKTTMVCDYCGLKCLWFSIYDAIDERIDGWVLMDVLNAELDVDMVLYHACPSCFKKISPKKEG